ncbi:MAG: signal peptidase I [Candidatus Kapaibacteriales bacterium]
MKINWRKVWNIIIGKQEKKAETGPEKVKSFLLTLLWALTVVTIINGLLIASFTVPTSSMENTVMAGDFLFVNKFKYGPSTPQVIPLFNIPLTYYKFPGPYDPERGDVIVFVYPGNMQELESPEFTYFLKRCVAVAGDTLEVRSNDLYVNGNKQDFPDEGMKSEENKGVAFFPDGRWEMGNYGPIVIPKEGDIIELNSFNYRNWDIFIQREGHDVQVTTSGLVIDGQPATTYTVERDYCWAMGDNRDNSSDSRSWGFVPYENVVGSPLMIYWSWPSNEASSVHDNFEERQHYTLWEKLQNVRWERIFGTIE